MHQPRRKIKQKHSSQKSKFILTSKDILFKCYRGTLCKLDVSTSIISKKAL